MKNILILFAHPAYQRSRANKQLIEAVSDLESVTVHDLYEAYPDFFIDVPSEQQRLLEHDVIVFHHPFYWYSSPALLKEWQDLVLEHGFAYGQGGTALHGKALMSAVTTGGSAEAYTASGTNRYEMHEFLRPFEQTAHLCGMDYLPPYVAHDFHVNRDIEQHKNHARQYRDLIVGIRDEKIADSTEETGGHSDA